MFRRSVLSICILATAALTLISCGKAEDEATATVEERPIILGDQDVARAIKSQLSSGIAITGSLRPAYAVTVKAQVPGSISRMHVDRGTRVAQGQPLATIEAEGLVGQAAGARAAVASAQANVALARQRLESARTLRQAGAMSEIDFQAAQAAYEASQAQLAAAQAQATGTAEQAGRATVRSPIAGVIGERRVEQGEAVSPGDELFTVIRSDFLELFGEVPVDAAALIRPGQAVVFTLPAYPNREFRGEVARIEPMANVDTRQVGVYLRMRNPANVIPGQFATGRVLGTTTAPVVVVPESAVRGSAASSYVLVIENSRVVRRPVTLGSTDASAGVVAITAGLNEGDQVIVTPSAAIAEGARVQIGAAPTRPAGSEGKEN
jgi:membrane fusion protein (multidrug efflux system)